MFGTQEWANEVKMINASRFTGRPGSNTVRLWCASLVLNLVLAIKRLLLLRTKRRLVSNRNKDAVYSNEDAMNEEILNLIRTSCDLANAINWLPETTDGKFC